MSNGIRGALAGAAGTTALNLVTYCDMVVRARPASTTPEDTVRALEERVDVQLAADGPDSDTAQNRRTALGALLGIGVGVGVGTLYGLLRPAVPAAGVAVLAALAALAANAGSVAPMTALGVTDPRSWTADAWVTDLVPHLAYGAATAAAFEAMARAGR